MHSHDEIKLKLPKENIFDFNEEIKKLQIEN
jgi:hypothetical protein